MTQRFSVRVTVLAGAVAEREKSRGDGSKRRLSRQRLLTNVGKGSPCGNSPGGAAAASCWGTEREVCHIPAHEGSDLRGPEVWADGNGDNTLRCALWEGGSKDVKFFSGSKNSMVEADGEEPVEGKIIIVKGQERIEL